MYFFNLLFSIFVIISFYYVFKFSKEIFNNNILGLISVLLIEAIYFLSVGRSFRATHDRDTINKKIIGTGDFTSIKANVSINQNLNEIQKRYLYIFRSSA